MLWQNQSFISMWQQLAGTGPELWPSAAHLLCSLLQPRSLASVDSGLCSLMVENHPRGPPGSSLGHRTHTVGLLLGTSDSAAVPLQGGRPIPLCIPFTQHNPWDLSWACPVCRGPGADRSCGSVGLNTPLGKYPQETLEFWCYRKPVTSE